MLLLRKQIKPIKKTINMVLIYMLSVDYTI